MITQPSWSEKCALHQLQVKLWASGLEGQSDIVLLVGKVIVHGLHLLPGSNGGVDVGLRLGDLVLELLLVLGELGALEVWLKEYKLLQKCTF